MKIISILGEGYTTLQPLNSDEYPNRESQGLEGPIRLNSGLVVYYDKKEGKYYNPKTDIYLEYDEYEQHNRGGVRENFTGSDEHVASELLASILKDRQVDRDQVKHVASNPKQAFWLLSQIINNGRDPNDYGHITSTLIYGIAKDQDLNFQLAKLYQQNGIPRPNETHIKLGNKDHRDELEKMPMGHHSARQGYEGHQNPKDLEELKNKRRERYPNYPND